MQFQIEAVDVARSSGLYLVQLQAIFGPLVADARPGRQRGGRRVSFAEGQRATYAGFGRAEVGFWLLICLRNRAKLRASCGRAVEAVDELWAWATCSRRAVLGCIERAHLAGEGKGPFQTGQSAAALHRVGLSVEAGWRAGGRAGCEGLSRGKRWAWLSHQETTVEGRKSQTSRGSR